MNETNKLTLPRKAGKGRAGAAMRRDKKKPSWLSELPSFAIRLLEARPLRRMPDGVVTRCGWD